MPPTNLLDIARELVAAGFSVIPIRTNGTKAPACAEWKTFAGRLPTDLELVELFAGRDVGIAVIGGTVSNFLVVLDFETGEVFEVWAKSVADLFDVNAFALVETPGGGRHLYVRTTRSFPSVKLAMTARAIPGHKAGATGMTTLAELKAEGGYVVSVGSPPTCHLSGRTWTHIAGPSIAETGVCYAGLLDMAIAEAIQLDETPPADPIPEREPGTAADNGDAPGTAYNRAVSPADFVALLETHGWAREGQRGGTIFVRRPGKDIGASGTVGYCAGDDGTPRLFVFSSNAAPFEASKSYSAFAAKALLEFEGDFAACARSLNGKAGGGAKRKQSGRAAKAEKQEARKIDPALPTINLTVVNKLARRTELAWEAVKQANAKSPSVFLFGGAPCRLEHDEDGRAVLVALDNARAKHLLERVANWVELVQTEKGKKDLEVPRAPTKEIVEDFRATPEPPLPVLRRLTTTPCFTRDGEVLTTRGYHAASGVFYDGDLNVPEVDPAPTPDEVEVARNLIVTEMYADFPFVTAGDRAAAVGLFLLPFVRELIDGPTPLHLVDKPAPATGASLLIETIAIAATGHPPMLTAECSNDEAWAKKLLSILLASPDIVCVDNLRRTLDSGTLSEVLTADEHSDRVLGQSRMARPRVRCTWAASANNAALSNELVRRVAPIRLDAGVDRPDERPLEGFRHPHLLEWVRERRPMLVWAALVLCRAWWAAGRPTAPKPTLASYESWARVIGGILATAGIDGFLGNLKALHERADEEGNNWRAFAAKWWETHLDHVTTPKELQPLAAGVGMSFGGTTDNAELQRFGRALRKQADRVFGVYRVLRVGHGERGTQYRLLQVGATPQPTEEPPKPPPAREDVFPPGFEATLARVFSPGAEGEPNAIDAVLAWVASLDTGWRERWQVLLAEREALPHEKAIAEAALILRAEVGRASGLNEVVI